MPRDHVRAELSAHANLHDAIFFLLQRKRQDLIQILSLLLLVFLIASFIHSFSYLLFFPN